MISYVVYKVLHLVGIFALLLSLGGLLVNRSLQADQDSIWRKPLTIINGIALAVILIAGFGLLARLGASWPWPGWVFFKILIWLFFAGSISLVNRISGSGKVLWWLILTVACVGAYLAVYKPF